MESLSLLSLSPLPWIIQSEIIYIVCNYRRNEFHRMIKAEDVFHVAGVSRRWRDTVKSSLRLNWKIEIERHSLEDYCLHTENSYNLLSGHHHTIALDVGRADGTAPTNRQYVTANHEWFRDDIIARMSQININHGTRSLGWMPVIGNDPLISLVQMTCHYGARIWSLNLFQHLESLDITFDGNTTDQIPSILENCLHLKTLRMTVTGVLHHPEDLETVFANVPSTVTKIVWGNQYYSQPKVYVPTYNPLPFHLLPTSVRQLAIWNASQICTQAYYDFVMNNSIQKIAQLNLSTLECIEFLSSHLSPVKNLRLHLATTPPPTIDITGKALVPPMVEVLTLGLDILGAQTVVEGIFNHSGPLPNLHRLNLDIRVSSLHTIILFIQNSKSLRVIDLCVQQLFGRLDLLDQLLDAVATSPSIQKMYLKPTGDSILECLIKKQSQFNHLLTIIDEDEQTIINTHNNHIDLSSYTIAK
ncbi:hypothetical protein DFA_07832 [Cavenderia fasciculata]|uniref:F-box domain-containing protein n=1 Tax=Cavenderia fasciculata TaxID=261658 RepID=F4Q3N7_CACFS|nr:uncharacterized protein DFA_07832 [Cavenderia fasciculata]EGG16853.1 hypothetical protein DFA_07832 [Cavenderia fasciculata]|eukprot:XP_004355327.1 hypothetical protein DFA_07832 [Cavenderia fasciculata]